MPNEYLGIYGEINNGAHQKAADLVGAPALVWHQAFWNSQHGKRARDNRATTIQNFLLALESRLATDKSAEFVPLREPIEILDDDRVRTITFVFKWQGMRAKIRAENHTEYLTLTSIIDASVDFAMGNEAKKAELCAFPRYVSVENAIEAFIEHAATRTDASANPSMMLARVQQILYFEVWAGFFSDVLNVGNYLQVRDPTDSSQGRVPVGLKFADFRSLVTCEKYPESEAAKAEEARQETRRRNPIRTPLEQDRIRGPFYREREEERGEWQRVGFPSAYWARERLNDVWPFLLLGADDAKQPYEGRTEFTVSRLLDGRVLYATALGPQPKIGAESPERPLLFYMHSVTQCERQIGRLLDRLCQLGTLRLAAIIALPALKRVGQRLWEIEAMGSKTREQLHQLIQGARGYVKNPEERELIEKKILEGLESIHHAMADLSKGELDRRTEHKTKVDPMKEVGGASIEYRLVRSAYYRRQFFEQLQWLRVKRLEGYQPYNEFVRRRLESAFNFIGGIERRIEQIKSEWRALDQLYLTTTVTVLTAEIREQEAQIGLLQTEGVQIQDRTEKIQEQLREIQIWGEAILIGVLVPYYAITLLFGHILHCGEASTSVGNVGWFKLEFHGLDTCSVSLGNYDWDVAAIVAGLVWFSALVFAGNRLLKALREVRAESKGAAGATSSHPAKADGDEKAKPSDPRGV